MEKLGFRSFFETYMFHPRSKELSTKEKVVASIGLAIFCFPPLCAVPLSLLAIRKWEHRHDIKPFVPWKPNAAYCRLVDSLALKARGARRTQTAMPNMVSKLNNVCYFNSAVQCLEALFFSQSKAFRRLLRKDLSLQEGEDLNGLEKRLLKRWAPCIIEDPEEREKALLFKWTFLVMLQAKEFGSSSDLKKAILAHREVMFGMGNLITKEQDGEQEDAALYFDLFMDRMNMPRTELNQITIKKGVENVGVKQPLNMIQLPLPDRPMISLPDLIARFFTLEKTSETTFKRQRVEGDAPPFLMFQIGLFGQKTTITKKTEKTERQVIRTIPGIGEVLVNDPIKKVINRDARTQFYRLKTKLRYDPKVPVDLSRYFDKPDGTHVYKLVATCNHHGETSRSGHYTATRYQEEQWYNSDDLAHGSVNKPISKVDFSGAYILLFQKIELEALQEDA